MIPINYNYWGIPSGRTLDTMSDVEIGDLVDMQIWGYFYPGDPNNADRYAKPMDTSVYLWNIKPTASFGTNAAFCISTGNTLDWEVSTNVADQVPLAMAACDISNIGGDFYAYFFTNPEKRLAYDLSDAGNYVHSELLYDIRFSQFCVYPTAQCFDFRPSLTTPTVTGKILETSGSSSLRAAINADPDHVFVSYLRGDLYAGTNSSRAIVSTDKPTGTFTVSPVVDLLTDRPIPSNATAVKNVVGDTAATPPHDPPYINDKVYSPFIYPFRRSWYESSTQSVAQQLNIGTNQQYSYNAVRNGAYAAGNGERVTGQFMRYNPEVQYFDDVVYKWEVVFFDITSRTFLQPGFDISSMTGNCRIMTKLVILDKKGVSIGEATERAVKHEWAFTGFYFAQNSTLAASGVLGSSGNGQGIYLPEIVNRTTTGRYFTGDQIKDVPYADADSVGGFPYDPGEVEGNEGDFSTQLQSGVLSAGTVYYALSDQELKDLLRFLNTTYNPDETTLAEDFKGANPFEYITSVKYYPFCLPYAVSQQINVGPIATGVTGYILPYTYGNSSYSFFDMGSFTFTPRYNNFLDYSGTQINIYLPWCGTKQLDPAMWIASPGEQPITLNIKYSFDYVTGAVTAFLFRDSMLIDTADGQVGIDIPMSALATGSYQAQIAQAQIAYKQAATSRLTAWLGLVGSMIGTAVAAASGVGAPAVVGGLAGIATSVQSLQKTGYAEEAATYTLDHTSPNVGSISAASPFNAAIFDQRPRILISRPQLQQLPTNWAESYGKSIGYACSIPTKLNNAAIKGLTVVQAPRLQGIKKVIGTQTYTPTREELDLIRQAMAEGIIL